MWRVILIIFFLFSLRPSIETFKSKAKKKPANTQIDMLAKLITTVSKDVKQSMSDMNDSIKKIQNQLK